MAAQLGGGEEIARVNGNKKFCKYGSECYQKNPEHRKRYSHPTKRPRELHNGSNEGHKPTKQLKEDFRSNSKPSHRKEEIDERPASVQNNNAEVDIEDDMPPSPQNMNESIKQKFLVEMPQDFYDFWEFCKKLNSTNPEDALKDSVGLRLVGPFDVLSGKLKAVANRQPSSYLRHWRYYYDPPEFQTVLAGDDGMQFHIGYFRDDPNLKPDFVAANSVTKGCSISSLGPNLFAAVNAYVQTQMRNTGTPEKLSKTSLQNIQKSLEDFAKQKSITLEAKTASMRVRDRNACCKTFHGAGMLVPYDKKTEIGYRPLPESNMSLKKILQRIADSDTEFKRKDNFESLHEIITLIQFANDECDYGMGMELGLDLFCFGDPTFHSTILHLLPLAYELLGRHQYATIIKSHLKDRKEEGNLSIM